MDVEVARYDASYVLDWLRQTGAGPNIIGLQERVCEALGGYVNPMQRAGLESLPPRFSDRC